MSKKDDYQILINKIADFNAGWFPDWEDEVEQKEYFVYHHDIKFLDTQYADPAYTQILPSELYMRGGGRANIIVVKALGEKFIISTLWGRNE